MSSSDRYSRTFDVLELLAGAPEGMTATEIARRLELPISSSHNLLKRMVATEVASLTNDLRYSIGPRAVRFGLRIVDGLEVRAVARPRLLQLARETGDDVYLAVPFGKHVAYVDKFLGTRPVSVDIRLGQSLYLHATSVGKLFAAYDPELQGLLLSSPRPRLTTHTLTDDTEFEQELAAIKAQGYSVSREEAILGVVGLAIPLMTDTVVAAIHISALSTQMDDKEMERLLAAAREAANDIERSLGRGEDRKPGFDAGAEN